jgi:hypothetical protein
MNNDELFPVEAVAMDSPRLAWMKRNNILTHFSSGMPDPWLAIAAMPEDVGKNIGQIMAESCRLYDEANLCGYGATEEEAIVDLAEKNMWAIWNEEGS